MAVNYFAKTTRKKKKLTKYFKEKFSDNVESFFQQLSFMKLFVYVLIHTKNLR